MSDTPVFLTDDGLSKSGANIRHGFFTRRGGVSTGIYEGLNTGFGSDDARDAIAENRARAERALGAPAGAFTPVFQYHSSDVAIADRAWSQAEAPKADASVTDRPGVMLAILTADCAPVLFADGEAGVIGAAHSGWKGAIGGIWRNTVEAMERLGAKRARITACVGPTIQQRSYEVGPEFRDRFIEAAPGNAVFFIPSERAGHHMFDLPGYLLAGIGTLGLASVSAMDRDTRTDEADFFSYRRTTLRSEPDYGRQVSAIMITDV